jgi:hypothetical protein
MSSTKSTKSVDERKIANRKRKASVPSDVKKDKKTDKKRRQMTASSGSRKHKRRHEHKHQAAEKKSRQLTWTLSNGVELCAVNVKSGCGHVGEGSDCKNVLEWTTRPGNIYCGRANPWVKLFKHSRYRNPITINKKAKDADAERGRVLCAFEAHCDEMRLGQELWMEIVALKKADPNLTRVTLGCWCLPLECHTERLAPAVVAASALATASAPAAAAAVPAGVEHPAKTDS